MNINLILWVVGAIGLAIGLEGQTSSPALAGGILLMSLAVGAHVFV